MAFAISHIILEKTPHIYGQGFPPKLRHNNMRRILNLGSWVQVCNAVVVLRCICRKADLKLIVNAKIGSLGKRQRAMTAELTIRLMHDPNMQGRSSYVMMRLLTGFPDDHSKLWSCVKRSFGMIRLCSLMVFCCCMFMCRMRMSGIFVAFVSGSGRQ